MEVRWAVFFDACGVDWEYEPEGYDLGNGLYYLPDFLLHGVTINHGYFKKNCGKDLVNMAYQTSCASYTSGRVGLSSATAVVADAAGREQTQHGSPLFPIACYAEDLSCFSVAWHWHEEFEFILAALGPIHVDVNKTRLTLQTGQGVFINSGALHAVEPAEGRALLHSGVFQPRLVGGMDTVFWHKLIRPLLQPGTPPFFLLDEAVPWQRQVLLCLREAWKGVADEPFDYENRVRYHLTAALRLLITQCVSGKVKVSEQEQIASERMKQMLRYVEEHYAEELTVEKLAGCVAQVRVVRIGFVLGGLLSERLIAVALLADVLLHLRAFSYRPCWACSRS